MSVLFKGLVMVNAKRSAEGDRRIEDDAAHLGPEEAGAGVAHHGVSAEAVPGGEIDAGGESVNFRLFPLDGESQRRIQDDIKVVITGGELPEVIGGNGQVPVQRLLEAHVV